MKEISSVKELCEFIWYLEDKYDLLHLEIDGVKPWQYLRMDIYYILAQKANILEIQNSSQKSFSMILKNSFKLIKNSILHNPFFNIQKVDNIVFTHNRSKKVDGKNIDIYTQYFIDSLKDAQASYLCYEKPFHGSHIRVREENTFYTDLILSVSIIYGKMYTIEDKIKLDFIKEIENEINNKLHIDFNLLELFKKNIGRFQAGYKIYYYLFSKIKPKKIYLVAGYSFLGDMIKAAKDLNIETFEFQHGVISKYHLGYSFPNKQRLEYYPNKFYSWGTFWNASIHNIFGKNIIDAGFLYFQHVKERYNNIHKIDNKIIIISQTALGNQIMHETLEIIDGLKTYQVYYKLHPEEYIRYKEYDSYHALKEYKNITFLKDCDLYNHLAESTIQIGVFSTALYEGIEFNCNTFLYDLPGVEYMKDLIETKCANMLSMDNISEKTNPYKETFFVV